MSLFKRTAKQTEKQVRIDAKKINPQEQEQEALLMSFNSVTSSTRLLSANASELGET